MATDIHPSDGKPSDQSVSRGSMTITDNGAIAFILTNKSVQHAVNVLTVAIFFYALHRAAVGPTDSATNFGSAAFFGLWWAPVMLFSLLLLGWIWCYACPMGAIVRFTQRFGLQRHFPMYTRKRVLYELSLSVLSLTALTFAMARWPMYKVGVSYAPRLVPYYWLTILGVAVGVSLVYQRQAFCRHVCPATGVMSVTAKLSPFEIAQTGRPVSSVRPSSTRATSLAPIGGVRPV